MMMNTSAVHATVDAAGMRAQNSSLLLKVIWRERHISRADIARVTGLSPSTVSAIVTGLQQAGLVRETGAGLSRGGRRPTMTCDGRPYLRACCDAPFIHLGTGKRLFDCTIPAWRRWQ